MVADLCVFDMGSRRHRRNNGDSSRKRPFGRFNALKNKELASLLYALTRAYTRLHALVRAYKRSHALISACSALLGRGGPSHIAWVR